LFVCMCTVSDLGYNTLLRKRVFVLHTNSSVALRT
jgi:hypothetical protein